MPPINTRWARWLAVCAVVASALPAAAQTAPNPLGLKPDHATASAADIDRAVRWYQEMLGFRVTNRGERPNGSKFADLELPGFGIGLVQNPGVPTPSTTSTSARSGWIHMVFSVPDVARAYTTLKDRGADVSTRGNAAPSQITTFLLHDSEGNEIEIVASR